MNTNETAYKTFLENKYRPGRTWYLETFIYPRYVKELRPGNVCDLGCGFGAFLAYATKKKIPVTGIDSNPALVEHCQQGGWQVSLDNLVSPSLSYTPASNVLCDNVLEHLTGEQIDTFLSNLPRFLQPGGCALFAVPNRKGYASDPTHKTFVDRALLEGMAKRHGLTLNHAFLHPLPWKWLGDRYIFNMTVMVFTLDAALQGRST